MHVSVRHFRQTLFWSLAIEGDGNGKSEDLKDVLKKGGWELEEDLIGRGLDKTAGGDPDKAPGDPYAEVVYFHPFVQRFLYGEPPPKEGAAGRPPLSLFYKTGVTGARVWLFLDRAVHRLEMKVDRLHLYVFDSGIAILALEVHALNPVSLPLAEQFLDGFRRAYPPYWETDGGRPGHCPVEVEWLGPGDKPITVSNYGLTESNSAMAEGFREFVHKNKTPRPASHWQYLLQPMRPWEPSVAPESGRYCYRQIEDERIPFMAYLSFDDPRRLTRADFVRLCFADDTGSSLRLPYSQAFLHDFEARYCYDRYWDPRMRYADADPSAYLDESWMTTRYLCSGYGFVMIGKEEPWFFADGKNGALAHFRRHYFQMGLIAHFQRAALLRFSDRLSQAVAQYPPRSRRFHEEVNEILEGFLAFVHRYWFREVSSQIQARELFGLWTGHLETQELFEQVKREAQDAKNFLDMREQSRQTETTVRLTVVATVGLAAGLVGSYLAIPWADLGDLMPSPDKFWKEFGMVILAIFVVAAPLVAIIAKADKLARFFERLARSGKSPEP